MKAAEEPQDKAAAQLLDRANEAQRLIPLPAEWSPATQRRIKQLPANHFQSTEAFEWFEVWTMWGCKF